MNRDIDLHIKSARLDGLPKELRLELKQARIQLGWTQAELGRRTGLPQAHISGIETGKVVPRFDTLLDLVRVLNRDLLTVPRELVPAVQALIRDYHRKGDTADEEERPLYAIEKEDGSGFGSGDYGEGFEDGSGFGDGNYDHQSKRKGRPPQ
jgi:transcriptional regulator with XRE-family HTH domain